MAARSGTRTGRRRPAEQTVLAPDLVELNIGVGGEASQPTLLLLHGLAARWQVFGPIIPALWESFRLLAPDFRGHGCSGHARDSYTLPAMVHDTRAIVDALAPGQPIAILGHSLGGWVALCLAAELPQVVRGVVIGDTAIDPTDVDPTFAVNYMSEMGMALRSLGKSLQQMDDEVMTAFHDGTFMSGYAPEQLLEQVRCPVLLLQADPAENGLMTEADVALARRHLHDVSHQRLDGVGHGLQIQDASAVLDVIEPFLASLPTTPPPPDMGHRSDTESQGSSPS